jgi:hypothetical protein
MGNENAFKKTLSPWQPETNKLRLALLGKLGEELAEASAAVSRCIIQGIDECEPVTGKLNREWLEDELADVEAALYMVKMRFRLNRLRMMEREQAKRLHLGGWHHMIRDDSDV